MYLNTTMRIRTCYVSTVSHNSYSYPLILLVLEASLAFESWLLHVRALV